MENKINDALADSAQREVIREIAQIAAIIADTLLAELYAYNQDNVQEGYIYTTELIGKLAIEFYEEHLHTDWILHEEQTDECWDDCIMNWAGKKFEEYKN